MGIQHCKRIFFLLIMVTATFFESTADAGLSSSGSWSYGQTETTIGSSTFKSSFLNEVYNLSLSKRVTKLINVSGTATLIKRTVDDGTTKTVSEKIFPAVTISFRPPKIYTLNLGFTRSDSFPENGVHSASTNMFASMILKVKKLPGLNLNYRRSISETFDPQTVHTVSDFFRASTNYGFVAGGWAGGVNLGYTLNVSENKISDIKSTSTNGNVGFNLAKSFFNKKLNLAFSSAMGKSNNLSESLSGLKNFEFLVTNQNGYYLRPTDGNSCLFAPCNESSLRDGSVAAAAAAPPPYDLTGMDLNADSWGVGLGFVSPQEFIFRVEVFVSTTYTTATLTQAGVDAMGFEVLTSGAVGGIDWQLYSASPTVTFEQSIEGPKFVIEFIKTPQGSPEQFIMVRNTSPLGGGFSIVVNEVRAYAFYTGRETREFETSSDRFSWNFSANFKPTGRLSMGYAFSYSTASNDTNIDKLENFSQGLNTAVSIIPARTALSFGISDFSTQRDGTKQSSGISMGMSLNHKFNPNLTTVYSRNQSRSFTRLSKNTNKLTLSSESSSDSFSLITKVYAGIDLRTSISFSETESLTITSESDSLSYRLSLKPWKTVSMSIVGSESNFKSTDSSTGVVTKGSGTSLNSGISFVPNRKVSFGVSFALEPTQSQSVRGSWRVSRDISFSLTGAFTDTTTSYTSTLSWRLMSKLSTNIRYSTTESDGIGTLPDSANNALFVSASMKFF